MNTLYFRWPAGFPRLLGSPKRVPSLYLDRVYRYGVPSSRPVFIFSRVTSKSLYKLLGWYYGISKTNKATM